MFAVLICSKLTQKSTKDCVLLLYALGKGGGRRQWRSGNQRNFLFINFLLHPLLKKFH